MSLYSWFKENFLVPKKPHLPVSDDDLIITMRAVANLHGIPVVRDMLAKYGAKSIKGERPLPEDKRGGFYEDLVGLLYGH
jgi:hypothetical protein